MQNETINEISEYVEHAANVVPTAELLSGGLTGITYLFGQNYGMSNSVIWGESLFALSKMVQWICCYCDSIVGRL